MFLINKFKRIFSNKYWPWHIFRKTVDYIYGIPLKLFLKCPTWPILGKAFCVEFIETESCYGERWQQIETACGICGDSARLLTLTWADRTELLRWKWEARHHRRGCRWGHGLGRTSDNDPCLCNSGEDYSVLSQYADKSCSGPRTGPPCHLEEDGGKQALPQGRENASLSWASLSWASLSWALTWSGLDGFEGTLVKAEAGLRLEAGEQKQSQNYLGVLYGWAKPRLIS